MAQTSTAQTSTAQKSTARKSTARKSSTRKRVFLHIGAPKTGTTFIQHVLSKNRTRLANDGVLYPYEAPGESFRSTHDFCRTSWFGLSADHFEGEWERIAARIREWDGSAAILSNELLSAATPKRIRQGVARLGDVEVHVLFSARDLARQLVSDWQEQIKHRHTVTLERYVDDLVTMGLGAPEPFGRLFWGLHDAAYVLPKWEGVADVQRIHIVTVPPPGAAPDALWARFCRVAGLAPDRYDTSAKRSNPSMGLAETELVRRINRGAHDMDPASYDALVRLFLAEKVLGGGSRITMPPQHADWVAERSLTLIRSLRKAGYPVEGDLEDLIPIPSSMPYVSPTELTDEDLGPAAIAAATALLRRAGRIRAQNRKLKEVDVTPTASTRKRQLRRPGDLADTGRRALGRAIRGSRHE